MAKIKLSRSKIVIIVAAVVLLAGIILSYLQYNSMRNLQEAVEDEKLALSLAEANLARLINHRDNADEYRHRLGFVRAVIPATAGEDDMLRYLYYLGDLYDIKVTEVRFDTRVDEEDYTRMPISLTMEGSYSSMQALLDRFHGGERLIRVDSLRLARVGGTGSSIRVSASANAFYSTHHQ